MLVTLRDVNLWKIFWIYWSLGSKKGRPVLTAETRVQNKLRGICVYNTVYTVNYVHAMRNPNINMVVYQTFFFPMVYAPRTQSSQYKFACPLQALYA